MNRQANQRLSEPLVPCFDSQYQDKAQALLQHLFWLKGKVKMTGQTG